MENMQKTNSSASGLNHKGDVSFGLFPRHKKKVIATYGKRRSSAGFALIEMIVVVTIIGILAAVAVPSTMSFVENGKQINRMNIARTIYLAAQNQLTKRSVEKSLRSTIAKEYFDKYENGHYMDKIDETKKDINNVSQLLLTNFPEEEKDNKDYVHYISKPKGYKLGEGNAEQDSFYQLLDEVIIDKSVLDGAILMEYNIMTGVILSIFYGDAGQEEFDYNVSKENENIIGGRGKDNGYQYAAERKQGYYGVETTGEVPLPIYKDIVNIYDGASKPLDIGSGEKKVNVLYVELLLAKQYKDDGITEDDMPEYTFEVINAKSPDIDPVISITVNNFNTLEFPTNFYMANNSSGDAIYRDTASPIVVEQDGDDVSEHYNKYIWIIDYIENDIHNSQPRSIGNSINPQNIRAKASRISDKGITSVTSLSLANTHFNNELSNDTYEIKTARHLNNIRYKTNGKYRQTADIDMLLSKNEITNFAPIENFSGEYYAMKTSSTQYRIINLKINSVKPNVGLFADISGTTCSIQGISLYKAIINATNSNNVGGIVGLMEGGNIKQCNSYANITVSSNNTTNVGGLVGRISNGTLDQSFNAGFYNAPDKQATSDGIGSITVNRGNIGGLVGINYGTIKNCFNNARVNINNVSVTRDGENLSFDPIFTQFSEKASVGGIVGYNNGGTIQNTYFTNFISLATTHDSTSGGIVGTSTGSGSKLEDNFFLANGCTGSIGSETATKDELQLNPCGSLFAKTTPVVQDNSYKNYPYPTLKNNNPFTESITWGWENIEDIKVSDTGLLYYELYNDNTVGFSGGSFDPLIPSGNSELVLNDGYVLDINYTSSIMTVKIGSLLYELQITSTALDTPVYTWVGVGGVEAALSDISSVIKYTVPLDEGGTETRIMLFFSNEFLEKHAIGEAYIDFSVTTTIETVIETRFNPLFANTVGKTITTFSVRSPRHFDNINKALDTNYSQGLNLDFTQYSRAAKYKMDGDNLVKDTIGSEITYEDDKAIISNDNNVDKPFKKEYNGNNFYIKVSKADKGLFANIGLTGVVRGIRFIDSVIGKNDNVGGIAAVNNGVINSCIITNLEVNGVNTLGFVVGTNNGTISNCTINGSSEIKGTDYVGGIAGSNSGTIENNLIESSTVLAAGQFVGGIAGDNKNTTSRITDCSVISTSVTTASTNNINNIGGIVGENKGIVTGCSVTSSDMKGARSYIGGIAGSNSGSINKSGVLYSTVFCTNTSTNSNNNSTGGIVGNNTSGGIIEDVFFLSVNDLSNVPVSATNTNANTYVGGIVGNNAGRVTRAFYFAPAPKRIEGTTTTIYPIVGYGTIAEEYDTFDTCYYLAGYRYSVNEGRNWISTSYNRIHTDTDTGTSVILYGGGMGMVTNFIAKEWIEFAYEIKLDNWYQPTNGYPYLMPYGISAPGNWPLTDSPTRPEQVDRAEGEWSEIESTSDRGRNVTFINGEFSDGNFAASECVEVVDNNTNGRRIYIDMSKVPGWSTRPVGLGNTSNPARNYMIELQEPIGTSNINSGNYNKYMASNYNGSYNTTLNILKSPYRYVELNADVQGTLYQLCATTPGANFYYSFHHASRLGADSSVIDQMNFYLTGVGGDDTFANDNALTLIRPCWSPREKIASTYNNTAKTGEEWGKTSLRWNPDVRDTVKYDTLGSTSTSKSTRINAGDLSYYSDKFTNWPLSDTRIYLYDVWIGDTTNSTSQTSTSGYGITFWSTSDLSLAARGYTTLANLISAASEAKTNVIGYWGISYGWKHYYGLYEVPEGQDRTEFAYQSRTAKDTEGNYLDGISFKSPGFLSIDKYIKDKSNEDAKFVTLNDELTVELHVTSYGEIPADNIIIIDKLAPYDEYIDYVSNSVMIEKSGEPIVGSTVTAPILGNGQTLTIALPEDTTLAAGETLKVTFEIKVRGEVKSVEIETLLFYLKNQAEVKYNEDKEANRNFFDGYMNNVKDNASDILQVYIDPIKLSKTVTPSIDGPFTVKLTVEDTLGTNSNIKTKGLVTDLIPVGFEVVNNPTYMNVTPNADGSSRIVIPNVNLGTDKKIEYTYTLRYTGEGYGVAYTSVSADYKYQYIDESMGYNLSVMMEFPKQLVGISVKTQDDIYMVDGGTTGELLNITENDNFTKVLADANYDVTPEVILLKSSVDQTLTINGAGNQQIDTSQYTAVLIKGSNRLEFKPKPGANGNYTLRYQIKLTATKTGNVPFELSSKETTVTVNVVGNTLVYYEKYNDNTYGFHTTATGSVPQALNDTKIIVENGYGVLSAAAGRSIQLGSGAVSSLSENCYGMYLYKLTTTPVTNFTLLMVRFGTTGNLSDIGRIHPNYPKAVYPTNESNAGNTFSIRTPQQMRNIGLVDTKDKIFIQERDLDFDIIDLNKEGAVVKGTFKGTFNGTHNDKKYVITNIRIDALNTDNVGLFSQNLGTIKGVTLRHNTSIKGKDNVGGIVGWNKIEGSIKGLIEGCVVEGKEDLYSGMHIEGNNNIGGIAGLNHGEIKDCTVKNTTQTIKGRDYVGGIAGVNDVSGSISGAIVTNVRLEAEGDNIGELVGINNNLSDKVDGETKDVIIPNPDPDGTDS